MKNTRSILLALLCIFMLQANSFATNRKVLFIGNSYTYTNNMPLMLQNLTSAMGDTLVYDQSTVGGYTFAQHCTYATTISKIFSQQWDIVVLQEQSEMPAFPPAEVDTEVYPYAHILDSMIHANDSCTQTMFLMTWGHANGDPPNCGFYPVICTYAGMQQRLRESYLQMTQDNNAIVAPVGAAWQVMMDSFAPGLWLYISDSSHPEVTGSYLESCVLYSSIYHKPTLGCTYTDGLATGVANTIQRVSDKVVIDSINQWQQYGHYPNAIFNYTCGTGSSIGFSDSSSVLAHYSWDYGDGSLAGWDTTATTTHTFSTVDSNYAVSLTASNNCFSETISHSVTLPCAPLGVSISKQFAGTKIQVAQQGNGNIVFLVNNAANYDAIEVYNTQGSLIRKYRMGKNDINDNLVPGLYLIRATSSKTGASYSDKIVVY